MKLSKQELINKIDALEIDEDIKISLMEDVTDSFDDTVTEEFKAQFEAEKAEMEAQIANEKAYILDLKKRYKERFLNGADVPEEFKDPEENPEMDEKEIVDITEI